MITITEIDKQNGASQNSYADTHTLAIQFLRSNGYRENGSQWIMSNDDMVIAMITEECECIVTVPNPKFTQMQARRARWQ